MSTQDCSNSYSSLSSSWKKKANKKAWLNTYQDEVTEISIEFSKKKKTPKKRIISRDQKKCSAFSANAIQISYFINAEFRKKFCCSHLFWE